jgi:hypothetical protein
MFLHPIDSTRFFATNAGRPCRAQDCRDCVCLLLQYLLQSLLTLSHPEMSRGQLHHDVTVT